MIKDIRHEIRLIVENISPYDETEKQHRNDVLQWIDSGADLFRIQKDAKPPKHLVSYTVLADIEDQKIILFHHKKAQLLLPSGGHVDINEHPLTAAKRELYEELGLELDVYNEVPLFITVTDTVGISQPHTDVSLWYTFNISSGIKIDENAHDFINEFGGYQLFSYDDILDMELEKTDPNIHRFVRKLIQSHTA